MAGHVTLDRFRPDDAPPMVKALTDPAIVRWLPELPQPYGLTEARHFMANAGADEYAIRVDGVFAGTVRGGDHLGYWVMSDFRRQGVARRAAVLALSRAFADGCQQVRARVQPTNVASFALLTQLGFGDEQPTQIPTRADGRSLPGIGLTLTREDFALHHGISIDTGRLLIDRVQPADLPALHGIATRPEVARMLFIFSPGMPMRDFAQIFPSESLVPPMRLAIRHEGRIIGSIGIGKLGQPDGAPIYYFMSPDSWGRGLGQEALAAFLAEVDARFDPPLLQAGVFDDNPASARMLQRAGFAVTQDTMLPSAGRDAAAPGKLLHRRKG
ncbi:GNAT family N-acetyltransferase [Paracoccus sp. M683]|uniref:GNAT family N-acetyltransferase n=1 Tax=Paracoccus sp. M683 TaxID=2594268 RepID=UPI00117C37EA|nr:GNAT family N-acetyltransferase [Paracoccus sp. M683]TRW95793.1 GNAT family N-acetyltransferase [Paracoccus sp. M683]